jgi:hypothetical protein
MGELNAPAARGLQEHLATCKTCRACYDALMEEEKEVRSGFAALARSLGTIEPFSPPKRPVPSLSNVDWDSLLAADQDSRQSSVRVAVSNNHFMERVKNVFRTHKRLIATAATLAALAAGLVICVSLVSSSHPAYALEQTAQANNQIKTCHVRCSGGGVGEAWIEMNPDGTPYRARLDFPKTEDGAKVVILTADKAEVWLKDKKAHVFVTEKDALAQIAQMRKQFDPKAAFEELQAMKASGKVEVTTQEPAKAGDPITLTATSKDDAAQRAVFTVNPNTKLVERMTKYCQHDGQWQPTGFIEYLDYNKEIDPRLFQLDVPKDVVTVDQINQNIGLVQGDLTKAEIAAKVVKEFFEALIAEDYAKAGLLLEGMPAEKMKEVFGRLKFHRIVEIGKPLAGKHPDPTALQVPAKVEVEGMRDKAGTKEVHQFTPYVRPVHGRPDRWDICGGI